jgi:NADPH:quinone reductase-like Zn-dependent oxidoreductase
MIASRLWPGFLGGGKRKISILFAEPNTKDLTQIAQWISTGQVKCLIDSEFEFENVPEAYRRLKTGRARGKVVVHVSKEASN